jgi:tetratricopeptide (TPR) repeat protein
MQSAVSASAQPSAVPANSNPVTIVRSDPPTPEQVGDSLSMHHRYQEAIESYSQSASLSPAIWNKMGIAYQMMFNAKDAARCYNQSLKLNPRSAQVLNNLATVYDSEKNFHAGERFYRKALRLDPNSALILRNLGSNLLSQHKFKKGDEAYRQAVALDPRIFDQHSAISIQNPASVEDRGVLHFYMAKGCVVGGNPECAIQNLRMALNEGYTSVKKVADDQSFASLRDLPDFKQMIASESQHQ